MIKLDAALVNVMGRATELALNDVDLDTVLKNYETMVAAMTVNTVEELLEEEQDDIQIITAENILDMVSERMRRDSDFRSAIAARLKESEPVMAPQQSTFDFGEK